MQLLFLKSFLPRPLRHRLGGGWNHLIQREHARQEKRFYRQFIKRGDLVFDVGANVGEKTAAFLAAGARVVAVEPNPVCVDEIRKMNRRALSNGSLLVEAVAVAGSRKQITLNVFEGHTQLTTGSPDFVEFVGSALQVAARQITVPALTLDDLVGRHGLPDFLKVDVEGMDAEVLTGLHRKPKHLSFEFQVRPALWENTRRCLMEVERLGFTAANVTESSPPKLLLGHWLEIKSVASELHRLFGEGDRWGDIIVK
jgi:FkbM family methyltransferase